MPRQLLLVHGAWHGAWCWERVIPLLVASGITVTALDLPGHGQDPGPLGDLNTDADRVRQEIDRLGRDIVLVGHSYGGAVITQAGDHPSVDHLVYLAAFALNKTESCFSAASDEPGVGQISHEGRPSLGAGFAAGPDGSVTVQPKVAIECFYNQCDDETVAWALARLGPQSLISLQQPPAVMAWESKPSTYIVCADDMAVHPALQRILARRCGSTMEWMTGHSPFLSRPELVAGRLAELCVGET